MGVIRSMLRRAISSLLLLLLVLGGAARAEPSEAERAARWSDLRHAIFGDRVVEDAGDLIAIDAPARAEDAAIVPVAIRVAETLGPEVRGLYLVIDDNPSPLAAHFVLGPLADTKEITTRVRIASDVVILPLRDPVLIAKTVASLDVLSGGRMIFGVGVGGDHPGEFAAMRVPLAERGARANESLEIVRGLWANERFSYAGRHYTVQDVGIAPRPFRIIPKM